MAAQHEISKKPELLLPAGSREAFYAALEAGADAVYLGLQSFNARRRANNFSENNLAAILHEARKHNVKIFITVNTAVKNTEIPALLQLLNVLERYRVQAVIVQDWGVFHLVKRYFPKLNIHASTQMAVHNSVGVDFCAKMGFERVILSRELTMTELRKIVLEATIGTEIFVHGALCYSFSGQCLFSSFIGGNSANRGLCTQPCRRTYCQENEHVAFFSLKDNQQIGRIKEFAEIGVTSLKIEGRLKSADYVYRVGTAYRNVLDNLEALPEAEDMLNMDFGREKTGYFLAGNVSQAITIHTDSGFFLGNVLQSGNGHFSIHSNVKIEPRNRILVQNSETRRQEILKIESVDNDNDIYSIATLCPVETGSPVFLVSENKLHFPNRFPNVESLPVAKLPKAKIDKMVQSLIPWQERKRAEQYFVRVNDPEWLKNLYLEDYEGIILNFDKETMSDFSMSAPILKKNKDRFCLEFPAFIGEKDLDFYATQSRAFYRMGVSHFILSHPSQMLLLPPDAKFTFNENCYVFNDATAAFFARQRAQNWIYPLENDMENLIAGADRNGIINMYFHPHLFHSRMPVKVSADTNFSDEYGKSYKKQVLDGITLVVPVEPVCLFAFKRKLNTAGFSRFLIDLTQERPDRQTAKMLLFKLIRSESIRPSSIFNFAKGLE